MCENTVVEQSFQKKDIITYDDVLDENQESLPEESSRILTWGVSDAPKLSSEDVLSETVVNNKPEIQESAEQEDNNLDKDIPETWSWVTQEEDDSFETLSLCENPLVWPIWFWAENPKSEVEKLERFLLARGENIESNGIYEQLEFDAIKKFQAEYRKEVLDPWGITEPTGYIGKTTVKKINEIACE